MPGKVPQLLMLEDRLLAESLLRAIQREVGPVNQIVPDPVSNAEEGLALLEAHPEIAWVSVDYHLVGPTTGIEFAVLAKARRPDLLIVLCTGNLTLARRHPAYRAGLFVHEVEKPIPPKSYADIWREVLRVHGPHIESEEGAVSPP